MNRPSKIYQNKVTLSLIIASIVTFVWLATTIVILSMLQDGLFSAKIMFEILSSLLIFCAVFFTIRKKSTRI